MIKHMRTDTRMIHGQVATSWMNSIGAKEIIVCNDAASKDKIMCMALPMAARGTPVKVLSIDDTVKYCEEHEADTLFVICRYASDALELLKRGLKPNEFNVGTNAPVNGSDGKAAKPITNFVYCNCDQAKDFVAISEFFGGKLTSQITPQNSPDDIIAGIKKQGLI